MCEVTFVLRVPGPVMMFARFYGAGAILSFVFVSFGNMHSTVRELNKRKWFHVDAKRDYESRIRPYKILPELVASAVCKGICYGTLSWFSFLIIHHDTKRGFMDKHFILSSCMPHVPYVSPAKPTTQRQRKKKGWFERFF